MLEWIYIVTVLTLLIIGVINMKKILTMILTLVLFLNMGLVSASSNIAVSKPDVLELPTFKSNLLSIRGEIKNIKDGRIHIVGEGPHKDIILNLSSLSYILDGATGTEIDVSTLTKGDKIRAYYGPWLTKSLPPQGNVTAIVVEAPRELSTGLYLEVAKVFPNEDGSIRVLTTTGDLLITLPSEVVSRLDLVQEGTKMVAWYEIMAMSMPGQTTATKAIILPPTMKVHLGAGVIVLQGKEVPLTENDYIKIENDKIMLPLFAVVKSLGYGIYSDPMNNEKNYVVDGFKILAELSVGATSYQKGLNKVELSNAPEVIQGTIVVPIEFFQEIMGFKVETINSHI